MANRNGQPFKLVVTLLFLLPLGACFESSEEVESNFGGSVGDGPITGALIEVWTADGRLVTNQRSDSTASYQIKLKAKRGDYPLVLTAKGGTDLVTNAAPDFELVSTLARPGKNKTVNLNPFSTFAIRTAQSMAGGLTEANVATADSMVMNELGFGLDTALISNAISGQVDNSNVAAVIKASEAVGEMLRRTDALLSSTGSPGSITDVINSLSDDLVDGVIDGRGAGAADPRIAALSQIVSAHVLLETMTNSLHVNGVLAVDAMDAAILVVTNGTGTQSTRDVPVTAGMLADLAEALRAAAVLGFPDELTAAISIVQDIEAGAMPAQVTALLPAGLGAVLDSLVVTAGSATATQIEEINDLARMDGLPPIDGATEHEVTITVEAGGSVLTSGSAGECTSTCTVTVADGEILILSPQPDSGFTFAGWGGACSGAADCALTVTSNLSVTAEFVTDATPVPTHFLSLTLTGNGSVLVAPDQTLCEGNCLIEFDEGQAVTLVATPSEGFAFDAWSGDCAGAASCTLTMSTNQQVNAAFSALPPPPPATHTITMSVVGQGSIALSPTGTICDSTCTVAVEDATVITAVAEPSPGHVFDAWSGDCSGSESCQLTVSSNKTLVATFSEEPPPVTNEAPVAVATANAFVTTGAVVSVSGANSYDVNHDSLTYTWVLNSKPANSTALLSSSDSVATQFQADMPGDYSVQLVVNDGQESSAPDSVTITASAPTNGSLITELEVSNSSSTGTSQQGVPITFGHPFKPGEIQSGTTLAAKTASGEMVPLQTDIKAFHADGSLRHAVLTALLPELPPSGSASLQLVSSPDSALNGFVSLADLPPQFDAVLTANIGGSQYSASARDLLESTSPKLWLDGPLVAEWQVAGALMNGSQPHPHLTARFYVRAYAGMESIRVSVVLENNWTYVPEPQNFIYDLSVDISGSTVFSQQQVNHFSRARWRRVFWWGQEPRLHVEHDPDYLIATRAIPNYDRTFAPSKPSIDGFYNKLTTGVAPRSQLRRNALMGPGLLEEYMPMTGGRRDIGPLPTWTTLYLLSQDRLAKEMEISNGQQAGSFGIHYRDRNTDLPVKLTDYPHLSTHKNAAGKGPHPLPACGGTCSNPYSTDESHQPSLAFVPYLVTGDYYFLEELQFWANQNAFKTGAEYRGYEKGLYGFLQVRGQAWSMRTLGQAAYITPDSHPLKGYFNTILQNNLDDYESRYITNPNTNNLGIITHGFAFSYHNGRGIAPWQDDFVTWAFNYLTNLGFTAARPMADWKAKFVVDRMLGPDYCWNKASKYSVIVRDEGGPIYATIADVWNASVGGDPNDCNQNTMDGYPDAADGMPSNMQPALAAAVDRGLPGAAQAWQIFQGRSVKPDYAGYPNWAIVPSSPH